MDYSCNGGYANVSVDNNQVKVDGKRIFDLDEKNGVKFAIFKTNNKETKPIPLAQLIGILNR